MTKLTRLEKRLTPRGRAALRGFLATFEEAAAVYGERSSESLKKDADARVKESAGHLFLIMDMGRALQ